MSEPAAVVMGDSRVGQRSSINLLPDELISKIMTMTNLKDVCRCMRISRKWEVVARDVIRLRKTLLMCSSEAARLGWAQDVRNNCSPAAVSRFFRKDVIIGPFHDSFNNCIKQMGNLVSLVAHSETYRAFMPAVQPIIVRNAATLRGVCCLYCPFPDDGGVQYPNLECLSCLTVTPEVVTSCPRLKILRLSSQEQPNVLQSVVNKQQLADLHFFSDSNIAATGIREMLDGLKFMTNLRKMRLQFRDSYKWIDRNKAWDTLFDDYHHLTEVKIRGKEKAINFDGAVRDLVRGNPQLKIFDLNAFWVTDYSLAHLAELHHLEKVILTHRLNQISASGVLTLLRGQLPRLRCHNSFPLLWRLCPYTSPVLISFPIQPNPPNLNLT